MMIALLIPVAAVIFLILSVTQLAIGLGLNMVDTLFMWKRQSRWRERISELLLNAAAIEFGISVGCLCTSAIFGLIP